MKLIIDIPEDIKVAISRMGLLRIPNEMQKKVDKAIQHGKPIPTGKLDGYTEWLEEKLLECEPEILCDVVSEEDETWCENNCENMRPECLRKCYEICKGEKPSSADRPKREWTTEQVAEMLANLFGDECACNFNGNDEWLPMACKYADTQCPDPKEKHGCWMQFLIQGGGGKGE